MYAGPVLPFVTANIVLAHHFTLNELILGVGLGHCASTPQYGWYVLNSDDGFQMYQNSNRLLRVSRDAAPAPTPHVPHPPRPLYL